MTITEQLMDAASTATITFTKLYSNAAVSFSPMSDIAIIDCIKSNKRIILMTENTPPGHFTIGVGDKANPNAVVGKQLPVSQLTPATVIELMELEFVK